MVCVCSVSCIARVILTVCHSPAHDHEEAVIARFSPLFVQAGRKGELSSADIARNKIEEWVVGKLPKFVEVFRDKLAQERQWRVHVRVDLI